MRFAHARYAIAYSVAANLAELDTSGGNGLSVDIRAGTLHCQLGVQSGRGRATASGQL